MSVFHDFYRVPDTPNTGNWKNRHRNALANRVSEVNPIATMYVSWVQYANAHSRRFESGIGQDYVLGPEWERIGRALIGLLNGDCGALDCGTLDGNIRDTLSAEGYPTE